MAKQFGYGQRRAHLVWVLGFLWVVMLCMPHCSPVKTPGEEKGTSEPLVDQSSSHEQHTPDNSKADAGKEQPGLPDTPDTPTPTDPGTTPDTPASDTRPVDRTAPERTLPEPPPERTTPDNPTPDKPTPTTTVALTASVVSAKGGMLLVSNGVPFAAGVVTSAKMLRLLDKGKELPIFAKPLARWQDGSLRAVLIQFQRTAAAFPAPLSLEVGKARTTTDRKETPVTWTLPQAVAFPTPAYMSNTLAFGRILPTLADNRFAKYDQNAVTYYNQHKGDKDWGKDTRLDGYYSTTLTWYMLFLRSGTLERYQWARREAVHYREDQIIKTGSKAGTMNGRNEPRYLYMQAMEIDYLLNGDPKTLQVAGLMAKYLQGLHPTTWYHYKKSDTRFWTERRAAFPLLGLLVYGRWTGDKASLQLAKQILDKILDTQKEWPDGGWLHSLYAHDSDECATRSAYGGSPFMTGLMFEALIAYYLWTKDPRIVPSIKKATDWLWTKGWKKDGFVYLIGCGTRYTDSVPDLNLLIAHGFAFSYWANGKKAADMQRAWDVFNQGVANAFLKTRKHYNQNYRSSFQFLWFMTK